MGRIRLTITWDLDDSDVHWVDASWAKPWEVWGADWAKLITEAARIVADGHIHLNLTNIHIERNAE